MDVKGYVQSVQKVIAKLLLLAAMLLMPLGMGAAPAAATAGATHAAMPMQHCPEQVPAQKQQTGFAQCTMVCSAAVAAVDAGVRQPLRIVCAPELNRVAQRLRGIHPEAATPPPRHS